MAFFRENSIPKVGSGIWNMRHALGQQLSSGKRGMLNAQLGLKFRPPPVHLFTPEPPRRHPVARDSIALTHSHYASYELQARQTFQG